MCPARTVLRRLNFHIVFSALVASFILLPFGITENRNQLGSIPFHFQKIGQQKLTPETRLPNKTKEIYVPSGAFRDPYRAVSLKKREFLNPLEREKRLMEYQCNGWKFPFSEVPIYLLTDDGNARRSEKEWETLTRQGIDYQEEYTKVKDSMKELFPNKGFVRVFPRGSNAEQIIADLLINKEHNVVIGPIHVEPGGDHVISAGGSITAEEFYDHWNFNDPSPFAADLDLKIVESQLRKNKGRIAYGIMQMPNNELAGQTNSIDNLKKFRELWSRLVGEAPLVLDAARLPLAAELIKRREKGYQDKTVVEIIREISSYFDIIVASGKKSWWASDVGGFMVANEKLMNEAYASSPTDTQSKLEPYWSDRIPLVSNMDIALMAAGLKSAVSDVEVAFQFKQAELLWYRLKEAGLPVSLHPAGYAVFINAREIFQKQIAQGDDGNPAVTLGALAYWMGGIWGTDWVIGKWHLHRLTIPRRRLTVEDIEYIAKIYIKIYENRDKVIRLSRLNSKSEKYLKIIGRKPFFGGGYTLPEIQRYGREDDWPFDEFEEIIKKAPRYERLVVTIDSSKESVHSPAIVDDPRSLALMDFSSTGSRAFELFVDAVKEAFPSVKHIIPVKNNILLEQVLVELISHWPKQVLGELMGHWQETWEKKPEVVYLPSFERMTQNKISLKSLVPENTDNVILVAKEVAPGDPSGFIIWFNSLRGLSLYSRIDMIVGYGGNYNVGSHSLFEMAGIIARSSHPVNSDAGRKQTVTPMETYL